MNSAYVTFDEVKQSSGAGKVCYHEVAALANESVLIKLIQASDLTKAYPFNPFLQDYFAAQLVPSNLDLLHLSCSPGLALLAKARPKHYVVNIVAHDLSVSIAEHERYYGSGTYPFLHNTDPYLHRLLLSHCAEADCIITPSQASACWIRENIKPQRIEIIPHGVDEPKNVGPMPEQFTAGYLGAFGPDKGLIYLLEAWSQLSPSILLLGGTCSEALKQLIGAKSGYEILGWVPEVSDFYNQLGVYVQPSVTEGFGIEILEAMSHGRPVIASAGAGGADVIEDGVDGFVIPPRDVQALVERLAWFKAYHPNRAIGMGLKAQAKAKNYTWDKIESHYRTLYQGVLGENSRLSG